VAVASAERYASLHLAPDSTHHSFLQARCHSCRPTNSVKALKAIALPTDVATLLSENRNTVLWTACRLYRCVDDAESSVCCFSALLLLRHEQLDYRSRRMRPKVRKHRHSGDNSRDDEIRVERHDRSDTQHDQRSRLHLSLHERYYSTTWLPAAFT